MATIKIDRGFTQKIQAQGLAHSPSVDTPPPPKKKPQGSKSGPPVALIAVVGVVVLVVIVGACVFSRGGRGQAKSANPAAARPAKAAVQPAAAKDLEEPESVADPEMELYAEYAAKTNKPAVQPQQQNKPIAPPAKTVLREIPLGGPQGLLCEYFENIPSKQLSALRASSSFPSKPDRVVQVGAFELSDNVGNQYGVRIRGFLVPSVSGQVRFSVCADDAVEFSLSEDASPERLRKLVSYESCVPKNKWDARRDQESPACDLVAGKRYYLEALLKEDNGSDYLSVAWKGSVSENYVIIGGSFLVPWSEASANAPPRPAEAGRSVRAAREALQAPAREAVEEQWRKNAGANRYAEAAEALKNGKAAWQEPAAREFVETAILRLELLGRLRAFVQAELAKAPVRGVWTSFGGALDVTTASDEGVTVAPGRIVAWDKVPADQLLKLVHATVPKAVVDPGTKSMLCLAAAVFCKEVSGGVDLALKYRGRAVANQSSLAALADRVLGGTPESIQAELRMKTSRDEMARLSAVAVSLGEKVTKLQGDLASVTGLVSGVLVEYWEKNPYGSLKDVREKGLLNLAPDSTQVLTRFETPRDHAEKFVARLRGYLTPPETGEYYFYVAADDQGELWLSTDETPEKAALCVKTETYGNYRVWDKETRRSKPTRLVKGQHYFVEALLREGEKSDHLSIAWSPVADDAPEVVTSENVLYAATAGFTPRAQDIRLQIEADLNKVKAFIGEVDKARAADQELIESDVPASPALADQLQQQVSGVRESLRKAESHMRQIDEAIPQLKAASQVR